MIDWVAALAAAIAVTRPDGEQTAWPEPQPREQYETIVPSGLGGYPAIEVIHRTGDGALLNQVLFEMVWDSTSSDIPRRRYWVARYRGWPRDAGLWPPVPSYPTGQFEANSDTCPEIHRVVARLGDVDRLSLQQPDLQAVTPRPPPAPLADADLYTIRTTASSESSFGPRVTMTGSGGGYVEWAKSAQTALTPCWFTSKP